MLSVESVSSESGIKMVSIAPMRGGGIEIGLSGVVPEAAVSGAGRGSWLSPLDVGMIEFASIDFGVD